MKYLCQSLQAVMISPHRYIYFSLVSATIYNNCIKIQLYVVPYTLQDEYFCCFSVLGNDSNFLRNLAQGRILAVCYYASKMKRQETSIQTFML